jgi:hypothetical protein
MMENRKTYASISMTVIITSFANNEKSFSIFFYAFDVIVCTFFNLFVGFPIPIDETKIFCEKTKLFYFLNIYVSTLKKPLQKLET